MHRILFTFEYEDVASPNSVKDEAGEGEVEDGHHQVLTGDQGGGDGGRTAVVADAAVATAQVQEELQDGAQDAELAWRNKGLTGRK